MLRIQSSLALLILFLLTPARSFTEPPGKLALPPNTSVILDLIYSGRRDLALPEIQRLQQQSPEDPLGYLLEAESQWWEIWCSSAEFKWGMSMARRHERAPGDQHYLDLTAKAYALAESQLRRHDSAEMYLYAGLADALAARFYALSAEYRATARVGVRSRENFTKALALDPSLADAESGLGLYNYYVDTLSSLAKVMRFFMGIPGGTKEEGVRQLLLGIEGGQLSPPVARFYLAINLHNYDQRYELALQVIGPLADKYPQNPLFQLVRGDLYAKLGRKKSAEACYRAADAAASEVPEPQCRVKVKQLVQQSLAALELH